MISIARQKHQKTWRDSTCVSKHLSTDWLLKLTKTSQFISDGLLWSTPNMRCCWNVRLFCINRPLEAAAAVVWGAEHLSGPSSPPKQLCWKHNGQLYHNIYRKTRISDVCSRGDFPGRKGRFLDQQEKKLCRQHAYQYPDSGFQSQSQAKWHSFIVIQYQPLYSEHQLVFRISFCGHGPSGGKGKEG